MKCTVLFASPRGEASNTLAAVGSAASAIELTCDELERCCGANFAAWVDVCKAWQSEQ